MNSFTKGILHSFVSAVGVALPAIISNNHFFELSVGTVLMIAFNTAVSYFFPTTTGASANQ